MPGGRDSWPAASLVRTGHAHPTVHDEAEPGQGCGRVPPPRRWAGSAPDRWFRGPMGAQARERRPVPVARNQLPRPAPAPTADPPPPGATPVPHHAVGSPCRFGRTNPRNAPCHLGGTAPLVPHALWAGRTTRASRRVVLRAVTRLSRRVVLRAVSRASRSVVVRAVAWVSRLVVVRTVTGAARAIPRIHSVRMPYAARRPSQAYGPVGSFRAVLTGVAAHGSGAPGGTHRREHAAASGTSPGTGDTAAAVREATTRPSARTPLYPPVLRDARARRRVPHASR